MRWYHWIKLAIFFVIGAVVLYWVHNSCNSVEAANLATVAAAIIAFFGLGGIYVQLRANALQAKRIRTYEFSTKIQKSEFYEHFTVCRYFLNDKVYSDDGKWSIYIKSRIPELTSHVYLTLAYFEDLGLSYNANLIDRKIIKKLLKTQIITYYEESQWLRERIERDAAEGEEPYKQWKLMYEDIK